MGPMRVSQKHCIEMVEGTRNHSLAKKYNDLLGRGNGRKVLISRREFGRQS